MVDKFGPPVFIYSVIGFLSFDPVWIKKEFLFFLHMCARRILIVQSPIAQIYFYFIFQTCAIADLGLCVRHIPEGDQVKLLCL